MDQKDKEHRRDSPRSGSGHGTAEEIASALRESAATPAGGATPTPALENDADTAPTGATTQTAAPAQSAVHPAPGVGGEQ